MKDAYYLCLLEYLFLCGGLVGVLALCPYPDFPSNGNFAPRQKAFKPGDEVTYTCKAGFVLAGKERRKCMTNGVWSDHTPFCDPSVPLSDPSITNKYSQLLSKVIDGKNNTCFDWHNTAGDFLYVHFGRKIVVRIIRIFLKKGSPKMQILTGLDNDMKLCEDYQNIIETDRWVEIKCKSNVVAKTMKILTQNKIISLCEIEVYGKDEENCDYPPVRTVPSGHFLVSRSKATLICKEGYKSENNRLVCERNNYWAGGSMRCDEVLCDPTPANELFGGEWIVLGEPKKLSAGTTSKLQCFDDYQKTGTPDTIVCNQNGTWTETNATCVESETTEASPRTVVFCAMGIITVILIIALLAAIIHFIRKQRNKEVVVVYHSQCDGSIPLSESEIEYTAPRYEPLLSKPPEPPSTPRPMAKLSTLSKGGFKQKEYWKDTLNKQALSPDLAFGTMKASTIYGS